MIHHVTLISRHVYYRSSSVKTTLISALIRNTIINIYDEAIQSTQEIKQNVIAQIFYSAIPETYGMLVLFEKVKKKFEMGRVTRE